MVRVDHLGIDDEPLGFSGRVYLDNEYQETCIRADAILGSVHRYVTCQESCPKHDMFGDVADVVVASQVLIDADGDPVCEDVFGDVKIFVSKKLLTEYRDKIPNMLPDCLYAISDK